MNQNDIMGGVAQETTTDNSNRELILHPTESTAVKNEPTEIPLTFGEKMVGIKFNPSQLSKVDQIKRFFADQIDEINQRAEMHMLESVSTGKQPDQAVMFISAQAIQKLKEACMLTVNVHVL